MRAPSGRAILLIDDHAQRKIKLSSRLRMQGFTIDVATSGFHAIHLAEKNKYNLVMMIDDLEDMPVVEALSLIRFKHTPASLPVIIMRSPGKEFDREEQKLLKNELVNEVVEWKDEFSTILRRIQRHLV